MDPKKPADAEKKPQVEITPNPPVIDQPAVTVDLNSPGATKPVVEQPNYITADDFRKQQARMEYEQRQLRKQLQDAINAFSQPRPPAGNDPARDVQSSDDDEVIFQQDYRKGIDLRAEKVA